MPFLLVIFILTFLCGENEAQSGRHKILRIGAVIEETDHTKEIAFKKGLEAANSVLQKSTKMRNTELVPDIRKVPEGDSFKASKEICSLLNKGIIALIGPTTVRTANHVQSVCESFAIPHLEAQWGYRQPRDFYSINLNPHFSSYGRAVLDYITKLGNWDHLGIIYYQDEALLKFENLLNNFNNRVLIRQWKEKLGTYKYVLKDLQAAKMNRFLVDIPYWKVKQFLIIASAMNMTTQYYSYIFTSWDLHLIDLRDFKAARAANISTLALLPTIDRKINQPPVVEQMIRDIYLVEREKHGEIYELLSTSSALIYDGMLLLAHGLSQLAVSRPTIEAKSLNCSVTQNVWEHGHSLINYIRTPETNSIQGSFPPPSVQGLTGEIAFDSKGRRTNFTLSILEVTQTGYQEFGHWNPSRGITVTKNHTQTKQEMYKILQNTTLRVVTIESEPFVIIKTRKNGKPIPDPSGWDGFCIQLLNEIAKEANFNYTVQLVGDGQYGSVNETHKYPDGTPRWNGMIGELMDHKADLAVASLTITYEREKVIDFTTPFMSLGLSIIFKKPKKEKPHLFSFLQPLSAPVWGYMVAAYISVSFVLFVVARFSPYEWYNPHPCNPDSEVVENQFNLFNSLWFTIGSLMQQGSDIAPRAVSTRIISGIWWFFTLIMISSYTANLAAFLTVERMKSPIENADDLSRQTEIEYGTLKGGSTYNFFKKSSIPTYRRMWNFMDNNRHVFVNKTETAIKRVQKSEGKYAFILESTWNEYYTQRNCDLMQVGGLLDSKGYGIGLPRGSTIREEISAAILMKQKEQVIDDLRRFWFSKYNISEPCEATQQKSSNANSLGIEQVGGVFVVLLGGMILSVLVSICEFVAKARKNESDEPMCTRICKELQFACRCMTSNKRPNLYRTSSKLDNNEVNLDDEEVVIKEILRAEERKRRESKAFLAAATASSHRFNTYPQPPPLPPTMEESVGGYPYPYPPSGYPAQRGRYATEYPSPPRQHYQQPPLYPPHPPRNVDSHEAYA